MLSQNTLNQLSRRKWLRDAAIAATSAAVLPSLLTGCTDHPPGLGSVPPGPPLGSVPGLSDEEWKEAAQNLTNINVWLDEIRTYNAPYIETVYHHLKAGADLNKATDFLVDLIIEMVSAMFETVLEALPGVGAVLAIAADVGYKAYEAGRDKRTDLEATIAGFEDRYNTMQAEVTGNIGRLVDIKKLKDAFRNGTIELLGEKYSPRQLLSANFPCKSTDKTSNCNNTLYYDLRDAAIVGFRRFVWKTMIIELGDFHSSKFFSNEGYGIDDWNDGPVGYARRMMKIPRYSAVYVGGKWYSGDGTYDFIYWYFEFGSGGLTEQAANILFIDDTPGHIMDPSKPLLEQGLFTRDCVFKQFHKEKQHFDDYRELGKQVGLHSFPSETLPALIEDTYVFKGEECNCTTNSTC